MKILRSCSLALTVLIGGCDTAKQVPREIVILPDLSASIDPQAELQMFAAIEDVALHLHRGDTLTIIPITGDAEAELQGRTLHYVVPSSEDRRAYDADLRSLKAQIKDDLGRLQADAVAYPGNRTDILGSIHVAMKEFSGAVTSKRLIVLSDFIQDSDGLRFGVDARFSSSITAIQFADSLRRDLALAPATKITLGRIMSRGFTGLPARRREAINAFWSELFTPAVVRPDGTFALGEALSAR